MAKEYPNSDVLERAYLVWMYHNKELRSKYLMDTIPGIFLDTNRRLVIFVMQKLVEAEIEVTIPNMVLFLQSQNASITAFLKKNKGKILTESQISDMIMDMEITSKPDLFNIAYDYLRKYAFARFVEDRIEQIKYWNSYPGEYNSSIVASAKAIPKLYDILSGRQGDKKTQLEEAMNMVNSDDEYISTSSQDLNRNIGGFSRGYVATLIAKSGHGKSSWTDYNTVHSLLKNKVGTITIISPEESAATRWRRIIALICQIPTTGMRQKTSRITKEHIEKVKEVIGDRLKIYDSVFKYKEAIDLMQSDKSDMLVLDHMQALEYPGVGDFMARMIGNIPGLVDTEKKIAKQRNKVILNLSQVNDKDIQRSDRLIKAPRYWDAYGSSVLYQASREFLALWYPIKDEEESSMMTGKWTINDMIMNVEKASFGGTGKISLRFEPDYNTFMDKPKTRTVKEDYTPPTEDGFFSSKRK